MTLSEWTPDLSGREGTKAMAITDAIAEDITAGRLKPGDRLPPHRELAYRLGVSVGTVTRSYAEAQRRGLLSGQIGSGTYVRERTTAAERFALNAGADDGAIDLSANIATCALRQTALDRALAKLPETADAMLIEYGGPAGMPRHREAGARWMSRPGLAADPARTVVTYGAQHALAVALSTIAQPGATILTEAMTFPPVKSLAAALGLRLHGVALDDDGLIPEALDEACRTTGGEVLYAVPTMQNPTGSIMSEQRRRAIAAVARRHDLRILEDDVSAQTVDPMPTPIAAFAPERTWFAGSVSKTLAPGLRVGYLVVPEGVLDPILVTMRAMAWMAAPLNAEIATIWMEDGTAEELIAWHRAERVARAALARDLLGPIAANPTDAPHLWLELPEGLPATAFAADLLRRGVRVAEGEAFAVTREAARGHVRVSLNAVLERERLRQALATVATALAGAPVPAHGIM
jgi:DNA-binding transcriptional MocR family regulator